MSKEKITKPPSDGLADSCDSLWLRSAGQGHRRATNSPEGSSALPHLPACSGSGAFPGTLGAWSGGMFWPSCCPVACSLGSLKHRWLAYTSRVLKNTFSVPLLIHHVSFDWFSLLFRNLKCKLGELGLHGYDSEYKNRKGKERKEQNGKSKTIEKNHPLKLDFLLGSLSCKCQSFVKIWAACLSFVS